MVHTSISTYIHITYRGRGSIDAWDCSCVTSGRLFEDTHTHTLWWLCTQTHTHPVVVAHLIELCAQSLFLSQYPYISLLRHILKEMRGNHQAASSQQLNYIAVRQDQRKKIPNYVIYVKWYSKNRAAICVYTIYISAVMVYRMRAASSETTWERRCFEWDKRARVLRDAILQPHTRRHI